MGKELDNKYYDSVFGKKTSMYNQNASQLKWYYPNWKIALDYIIENNHFNIVDLGCGPGHFSTLITESMKVNYLGLDFSETAISQAIKRNNQNNVNFKLQNLKIFERPKIKSIFTAFEFLEHISFDKEIISQLLSGDQIIFSVPNYDSAGHVRTYPDDDYIRNRYNELLDLEQLNIVKFNGRQKIFLYLGIRR